MSRAHYGLQALLYAVALHRYLRWRLPGYDPAATSPASCTCSCAGWPARGRGRTGGQCGVFAWRPPGDLVTALSDVLDGVARERDAGRRDPFDARRAVGAAGLLREFNDIGVLSAADVHVAMRWPSSPARSDEVGERSPPRSPCAARGSATCSSTWPRSATPRASSPTSRSTSRRSPWPAVGEWLGALRAQRARRGRGGRAPSPAPLRLLGTRLYLDRYWREERAVAADLNELTASGRLQVIAGGPGTGKTTRSLGWSRS